MKKIVFILFLLFIMNNVNAKTIYGPYSDYSSFSDEEVFKTDTVDVVKKKFYHAYKEVEHITYSEEGSEDLEYTLVDDKWVNERPEFFSETKTKYTYKYPKERSISMIPIGEPGDARIEFFIVKQGDHVMYHGKMPKFQDKKVILDDMYGYDDLSILVDITGEVKGSICLVIKDGIDTYEYSCFKTTQELNHVDFSKYFRDVYKTVDNINDVKGEIVKEETSYLAQKKLYKHVKVERVYEDLYLESSDEYKLDYDDYKYMYSKRTRDKIEIQDDIVITSYDDELSKFVSEDIKYVTNMNKLINGKYDVTFITPYGNYKTNVIVDIKDNYKLLLNEQQKKLELMYNAYVDASYLVEKKNQEIKDVINSSNDEYILEEYEKCKSLLEEEKNKKLDFNENKQNKNILMILFTISMSIGLFIKKFV